MLAGNLIHPLTAPQWIVKAVKDATWGVDAYFIAQGLPQRISGRVYDRDDAPRAEETANRALWPFVAYQKVGGTQMHNYGEVPLLGDGQYLITFVMWQSLVPTGQSLKAYVAQGQLALQNTFSGVRAGAPSLGLVHGCELGQEIERKEGTEGFVVREAGYMVHLRAGANL